MADLSLGSFAGRLLFRRSADNLSGASWEKVLAAFLDEVGLLCGKRGAVVGHIKAFAAGAEGAFLRGSLTDIRRAAEVEGGLREKVDSFVLDFNAHVYGLTRDVLADLVLQAAVEVSKRDRVEIRVLPAGIAHSF